MKTKKLKIGDLVKYPFPQTDKFLGGYGIVMDVWEDVVTIRWFNYRTALEYNIKHFIKEK